MKFPCCLICEIFFCHQNIITGPLQAKKKKIQSYWILRVWSSFHSFSFFLLCLSWAHLVSTPPPHRSSLCFPGQSESFIKQQMFCLTECVMIWQDSQEIVCCQAWSSHLITRNEKASQKAKWVKLLTLHLHLQDFAQPVMTVARALTDPRASDTLQPPSVTLYKTGF